MIVGGEEGRWRRGVRDGGEERDKEEKRVRAGKRSESRGRGVRVGGEERK